MKNEPVLVFLAGLAGVVALGLSAATGLGWIDADQAAAVVGFVTAATALAAPLIRARVSPVSA